MGTGVGQAALHGDAVSVHSRDKRQGQGGGVKVGCLTADSTVLLTHGKGSRWANSCGGNVGRGGRGTGKNERERGGEETHGWAGGSLQAATRKALVCRGSGLGMASSRGKSLHSMA